MYDGNLDSQPWRGTFVHRGLYQVYGGVVPENSVAAIKNAFGKHFAGVEIDIRSSIALLLTATSSTLRLMPKLRILVIALRMLRGFSFL